MPVPAALEFVETDADVEPKRFPTTIFLAVWDGIEGRRAKEAKLRRDVDDVGGRERSVETRTKGGLQLTFADSTGTSRLTELLGRRTGYVTPVNTV